MRKASDCTTAWPQLRGLPTAVLPGLRDLAERVNGKPLVVGPSWNPIADELTIPPIRTLGFRPQNPRDTPPILHAKLALLGRTWLREFDTPFGSYEQYGFEPKRLWISSANFTESSRRSLEFGYWSEDMHLMETVQAFLVELIAASEPLEPDSDIFDPQFAPVDYDDQAFIEALRDIEPDDVDDW